MCAMVLVNSYTGIVTSSLTTPKLKPSIDSLEELAASKQIAVLIRFDTSLGEQILVNSKFLFRIKNHSPKNIFTVSFVQKATSGVYKVLGDQARRNPDQIVGDPFKLSAKLETGRYAFPFVRELKNFQFTIDRFFIFGTGSHL